VRFLEKASFALEEGAVGIDVSLDSIIALKQKGTYTERFLSSLIALISIFLLPMTAGARLRVNDSTPL
jgi:hypothetical protein